MIIMVRIRFAIIFLSQAVIYIRVKAIKNRFDTNLKVHKTHMVLKKNINLLKNMYLNAFYQKSQFSFTSAISNNANLVFIKINVFLFNQFIKNVFKIVLCQCLIISRVSHLISGFMRIFGPFSLRIQFQSMAR